MSDELAIQSHAVSYVYRNPWPWIPDQPGLHSATLRVRPGEVHAMVGANGSGKSTLLKILVGQLRPASGEAKVLGLAPGHRALLAQITYLAETGYGETRLKVKEALELQAALHAIPRRELKERLSARLEEVGMQDFAKRSLRALSKGQRRRVALAQALLPEPRVVFLDEPFDGVDPVRCEELCSLLRRRAAAGMTVLFSTHSLPEVEGAADRLSLFAKGRIVLSGATAEITQQPQPRSLADLLREYEKPFATEAP